jgi:hypothetical protein
MLLIVLLSACGDDRIKGEFSADELSWLVYQKDQSISFKDSTNKNETLNVISRTELGQVKNYYPIEAEVILSDIDSAKSFGIYLLKDEKNFKRYLRIGEVYRSLDLIKPTPEIKIGDKVYKEVYTIIEDTTSDKKPHIWRALYTKEAGIIEYTNIRNQTYRLK